MATVRAPATPVTPAAQKQQQPTPTGSWKHPNFNEITRRQYATAFDERHVRTIVVNGALLAFSWMALNVTPQVALLRALQSTVLHAKNSIPYTNWIVGLIRLLFLFNIGQALRPLALRYYPDEIADIPLTPSQRQSMGLDPNVQSPRTPGSAYASPNYVTPPRYQKSTPRSSFGTPGDRYSPVNGSPRASMSKSTSNSPFSPSTGSSLFRDSATKRLSYDRDSPLSNSLFSESSSGITPGTPTPGIGKATVGLNNKWLYEKQRGSRGNNMFS